METRNRQKFRIVFEILGQRPQFSGHIVCEKLKWCHSRSFHRQCRLTVYGSIFSKKVIWFTNYSKNCLLTWGNTVSVDRFDHRSLQINWQTFSSTAAEAVADRRRQGQRSKLLWKREPPSIKWPAKNGVFTNCGNKGHFERVCRPLPKERTTSAVFSTTVPVFALACLSSVRMKVTVNSFLLKALTDTESFISYIAVSVVLS